MDAIGRQFEQIEVAVAQFAPDLDEQALMAAWESEDPLERNRVGLLLGCFEKIYMLLMDLITISVKLTRRTGAADDKTASASKLLLDGGVLSRDDLEALEKQREVRNTSQHIYLRLSMAALRTAVLDQLERTPAMVERIAGWVASLESASGADA